MTKPELVNKIAEKSNITQKQAAAALTALTGTITEALKAGEKWRCIIKVQSINSQ